MKHENCGKYFSMKDTGHVNKIDMFFRLLKGLFVALA